MENIKKSSLQKITYLGLATVMLIGFMIVGKVILMPLVFAGILALALAPICNQLEKRGIKPIASILLTFLGISTVILIILVIISFTFANIYEELPELQSDLQKGVAAISKRFNSLDYFSDTSLEELFSGNTSKFVNFTFSLLERVFSSSMTTITNFFFTFLYLFFLLYYRKGIRYVLYVGKTKAQLTKLSTIINEVQDVVKAYAFGLFSVMLMLGFVNSIGLWLIGIDYAFFWGFLAGFMIIIPYIGTTLGGILPFLYAFATTDTLWQPIAVTSMYFVIQLIEGNLITPNIVGNRINTNAMSVIIAMTIGTLIWGIAGIVLALPIVGILRVVFSHFDATKKLGLLLDNDLADFRIEDKLNEEKQSLASLQDEIELE